MKILQINNCHFRRGGADIVYLETGKMLERAGNEVSYFSTLSERNEETKYSKYFVEVKNPLNLTFLRQIFAVKKSLYSKSSQNNLKLLLENEKPDIAHLHLYKGALTTSILKTLETHKIPIVITLHDYGLLCPRNIFYNAQNEICEKCSSGKPINCLLNKCNRNNFFYSFVNYLEYLICNRLFKPEKYFDQIICVSKFNFQKHKSSKPELLNKLVHLYNFSPLVRKENQLNAHKGYFLYFGRLSEEKGIITLINAFKDKHINQKLKIVGTGPLNDEVINLVESCSNIQILGYKTGKELDILISDAMFVIVPSEWFENNPLTIIESYSRGTPVIGSNIGGIPELIIPSDTGFIFDMGNINDLKEKIITASNVNEINYIRMSKNALEFAEINFSEGWHYEKLLDIYKKAKANYKM